MTQQAKDLKNKMISENEEKLLDRIWDSTPEDEESSAFADASFTELQRRLSNRRTAKRRRTVRLTAGIAAAVAVAAIIMGILPRGYTDYDISALVAFRNDDVELIVGENSVVRLTDTAAVVVESGQTISLHTAGGDTIGMDGFQELKIRVPAGKRFDLTLSDGSHIWLNAQTSLEYPTSFEGASQRRVRLSGEAFFEVSRDEFKPFIVDIAGGGSVRVLGTSFNITAYEVDGQKVTTLVSGSVEYTAAGESVRLLPGEQVTETADSLETMRVDPAISCMWRDGVLYFDDQRLDDIAARLARAYGIEISVSPSHADTRFSGMIRQERGLDYIMKLLTKTSETTCTVEEGKVYLE